MQKDTEILLRPQTERPKRKYTRRKTRTYTRRAKEEDVRFLLMATVVNSALIALLFILHLFRVI